MREGHLKRAIRRLVFPPGAVRAIRLGPLRGFRFKVSEVTGMAPWYSGAERHQQHAILAHTRPATTAIDVGANWGLHTLLMSRAVGSAGSVIAIEPFPEAVNALRWHVEANACRNVLVLAYAVADREAAASFAIGPAASMGRLSDDLSGLVVRTRQLDDVWRDAGSPAVSFVKIDVEGGEWDVIRGARSLIESCRPVISIALDGSFENAQCIARMLDATGYGFTRMDDGHRVTEFGLGAPHPAGLWGSLLAVPCEKAV